LRPTSCADRLADLGTPDTEYAAHPEVVVGGYYDLEQLLAEEATRPSDDVVLRMLLSPRADKVAERLVYNAYGRAIQGFESYDTTVLMSS